MNERIKELAEQATTIEVISGRGFDETQYTKRFSKEKFAELIVRECAKLVDRLEDAVVIYSTRTGEEVPKSKIIKEHFGVEE